MESRAESSNVGHGGDCMTSVWESLTVDARDPARLARWWAEALGYQVVTRSPDEVEIRPCADRLPGLLFVPVPERQGRRRTGCTSTCAPTDQEAEVERLVDMGARHVDIGQGERRPGWCWPTRRATSSASCAAA